MCDLKYMDQKNTHNLLKITNISLLFLSIMCVFLVYILIYIYIYMYIYIYIYIYIFLWRHLETSSSRLFNKTYGSPLAIRSFSQIHKSHFREPQTYLCDFIAISQLIEKLTSLSFNSLRTWTIQCSFHKIYF